MCGIVGYIGGKNAIDITIRGLKSLEYRGYDSSGIAYINKNIVNIKKEKGKIENLDKNLDYSIESNIAIAHTRWATHGIANKVNAHPHKQGSITLVHNGIIENYAELKNKLQDTYNFKSDTDTEVIACLIDSLYKKYKDTKKSIIEASKLLKGSFALVIINENEKDRLFAIRKDSPLIVGSKNQEIIFASDIPAILHFTDEYYLLDNYVLVEADYKGAKFYDENLKEKKLEINKYDGSSNIIDKCGYDYFMPKEINEQPEIVKKMLNKYVKNDKVYDMFDISKYDEIEIVACGSAFHAGYIGKHYIEKLAGIKTNVSYASEFRYQNHFFNKRSLVIVISQSGETADTLAALKLANENNVDTLAIVNVYKSSIAREAKYVLYTMAGVEIAVATTKAYLSQVITLLLLALNVKNDSKIIKELYKLPNLLTKYINKDYKKEASIIAGYDHIFYLGREIDYYLALEGSLKLKEISYIHSEAYPAGELKHGTISLMDKKVLVIGIVIDDDIKDKTVSNLKEVMARNTKVMVITNENACDFYDYRISIKESDLLSCFTAIIPMQLLAYEVAKIKGCDIDKPRNLAKSVTVE